MVQKHRILHNTPTYAIFKSYRFVFFSSPIIQPDDIRNGIEEVVDLARQINLEVDGNDVRELLDSHHQERTMDELVEVQKQEQNIQEHGPIQSRRSVGNLTEGISLIIKELHKF
ncbi:hypothetical protein TNCV_2607911 [Trichonephila clavipes]|uniref:Uncharacterized protein n=1 Tax=Trichonephila clavipes TaxID=2585209 RepID=A0A8X6RTQ7_TRICX|nr:hypothetical protein TNCV_2607911 [Trichonephila clavipes]